ncbi:MAG: CBS domain-containing protein [Nanoarchaeota archaeon]
MTEKPIFLKSDDSLHYCAEEMAKHHVGAIVVKDDSDILGVLTEQDIVRKILAQGINPLEKQVRDVMETDLVTVSPDTDIFEALVMMKEANIRHLPVVSDQKLLGLLTIKDILKIEPQLFELMVEKFELREEERKPINRLGPNEGVCNTCGEYTDNLKLKQGVLVCSDCLKH